MNYFEEDSVVAEVRKNRAELLAEFDGNTRQLVDHLISGRPDMEADGWRYETEDQLEARKARHKQQQKIEWSRMEAI
jgi:hypothetical protein